MKFSTGIFMLMLLFTAFVSTASGGTLTLSCSADNDLYLTLKSNGVACSRYSNPQQAIDNAGDGSGVMILADAYPQTPTPITTATYAAAAQKNIKLYIEFPANLPALAVGSVRSSHLERGVVTSNIFGAGLSVNDIIVIHDCRYVEVAAPNPYLALAKVAGFDKAVFGLTDTETHPVLFEHPSNSNILVSTTKLSQFVTGRYVPKPGWRVIWKMILHWLDPQTSFPDLQWTQTVGPAYAKDDLLPAQAQKDSVISGIDWHYNSRMLVHESWADQLNKYGSSHAVGPAPNPAWPVGDGSLGLLEGVHSGIDPSDGSQKVRWWLRSDCNGESTLAFALRWLLDGEVRSKTVAQNLADWVYLKSGLLHNGDPSDGNYGLLGWAPDTMGAFYQDNDIKVILGCIGAAAILKSDRWDEALVKNILANFRTTGRKGFRGGRLNDPAVTNNGWLYYWKKNHTNFHPHYETWIWAAYLWLYDKTGYEPLLERTRLAITLTMQAYPDGWRWTNGFQQERGRMLLALAWLIRVDDTPEHRAWLEKIADDMMEDQVACGAIREELGRSGMGSYAPPTSNAKYGTSEASLIQQNGDPLADMLYTCNFAFLGLHEAYAATGNDKYLQMENKLAEFFIRIQVKSPERPELDGAWYRAFDYEQWDYWGSNADTGWGAWSVECGWTQGWITTVLALRELNLNLWDLTSDSEIDAVFDPIRQEMMPDDQIALPKPQKVVHGAVGAAVELAVPAHASYPGLGAGGLVDGLIYYGTFSDWPWMGWLGEDLKVTIDLGSVKPIEKLAAHFQQETRVGIYTPTKVIFEASQNGQDYVVLNEVETNISTATTGPLTEIIQLDNLNTSARWIMIEAQNLGTIPNDGRPAWLFADEVMVYIKSSPGDLNSDSQVNILDLVIMAESWLEDSLTESDSGVIVGLFRGLYGTMTV